MLLFLLAGCPTPDKPDTAPATCDELEAAYDAELTTIRACTDDDECGQVLTGTSCGCTRNLVARNDADTTAYYALLATRADECDFGLDGSCDCPEADGYDCDGGQCTWNYVDRANLRPCSTAEGLPYTLDAASIAGDTLTAEVRVSGGGGDHDFTLCWPDQSFMESEPVQVRLELLHEIDDPGVATESHAPTLDLGPLKAAWRAAYRLESGTITVHLDGETLTYTF